MTTTPLPDEPSPTRNHLGPLTTTFTPPSECFQTIAYSKPSDAVGGIDGIFPYGGQCGLEGGNGFNVKCFPDRYMVQSKSEPGAELAAYSPAFQCPHGWSTAYQISKDLQGSPTGLRVPANGALESLAAWLEPDEELTACCPSGAPLSIVEGDGFFESRCGTLLQAGSVVAAKVFPNNEICNPTMQQIVLATNQPQATLLPIHLVKRSTDIEKHIPYENLMRRLDESSLDNSTTNGTNEQPPTGGTGSTGSTGLTPPSFSSGDTSGGGGSSNSGLSTGAKIGIGVGAGLGGFLLLAAAAATVVFFIMRKRRKPATPWPGTTDMNTNPAGPNTPYWNPTAPAAPPPGGVGGGVWQPPQGDIARPAPVHGDWRELHGDSAKPAPVNGSWQELPNSEKPSKNIPQSPNASEMPTNYSQSFNTNQELDSQSATLTSPSQLPQASSPYAAELEDSTRRGQ